MKSNLSKAFLKKNVQTSICSRLFSTKQTMSEKFHEIYVKELEKSNEQRQKEISQEYKVENRTPKQAYQHPYHSEKFPIYWSTKNLIIDGQEAIGTEPVSPHYESFTLSRRAPLRKFFIILFFLLIFLLFLFLVLTVYLTAMGLLESINVNSFYGKHASYEVYSLLVVLVGINESRYIMSRLPMPKLSWFYNTFHQHEHKQLILNWYDNIEERTMNFLQSSKEQIDYYLIHKEYNYVKKRVLTSYLENQRASLNTHFQERTISMLNNIKNLENNNVKAETNRIAETALNNVLLKVKDASQNKEVLDASFESALNGLRKGVMQYENDKVLPLFLEELSKLSQPVLNLSPEEENKKFALTNDQKKYLIELDRRARQDFLTKEPEVSSAIKNTATYKSIVQRIKAKAEAV